ncbi:hypothetical protein S40288_10239 [Stachybotrys chartarum IBT 40288]|nr:hypothetical protein S40288_10239 [Stachybotrys chartarum IBT 40288]
MYLKLWIPEISALLGTGAMTGALVSLLLVYNGQPIFDWYSVTLNTIVSTLSVTMKALLLFAAAECIGQWKWIMLHQSPRTLIDFERVDQASRGPLGCFNLLWRKETPWLLRLGLFTIILTIAVDPFSQQLLQLDHRTVYNMTMNYGVPEAQIPAAAKYVLGDVYNASQTLSSSKHIYRTQINAAKAQLDFSMQSSILNGLVKPKEETQKSLRFDCPTGNCTWEPFVTLGVCHRCNNLTSKLKKVDGLGEFLKYIWNNEYDWGDIWHGYPDINGTALVLPNGHFMPNEDGCAGKNSWMSCAQSGMPQDVFAMTTYGTGNRSRTNTFQDIDTLIWSMSAIYVDGDEYDRREREAKPKYPEEGGPEEYMAWSRWPNTPVSAVECAAYFCLKTVQDEVRDNIIFENATELDEVIREFPGQYEGRVKDDAEVVDTLEMMVDNKNYTLVQDALVLVGGTDKWGRTFRGETPFRSYAAINVFLRETLTATWTDEFAALATVRNRIPGITELYNGQSPAGGEFRGPSNQHDQRAEK